MLCNKCRQGPPREGDTWCTPCSAWESVAVGLQGRWVAGGLREAAAEAVVGTARLVRSLRNLDAGLVAQSKSLAAKPREQRDVAPPIKEERPRSPLARARSSSVLGLPAAAGDESEYTYVDEDSEEEEVDDTQSKAPLKEVKARGSQKPPEPDVPPKVKKEDKKEDREQDKGGVKRKDHPGKGERSRGHRDAGEDRRPAGTGRRRKRHRGGRKHKRLHRGVTDPNVRLHRSLPEDFWNQDISRRSHESPHRD